MLAVCRSGFGSALQVGACARSASVGYAVGRVLITSKMSKSTFTVGAEGTASVEVTSANTAITMGSGSLEVFATPSMVALMEKAACNAIASSLDPSETTVGTKMDVAHLSATPVGCTATATAKLVSADGRSLSFEVCPDCGCLLQRDG